MSCARRLVLVVCATLPVACGSSEPEASDQCVNDVVQMAPTIDQILIAEEVPPAMGGTIVDGRYHLTSAIGYTGAGGVEGPTIFKFTDTLVIMGASSGTAIVHQVRGASENDELRQVFGMQTQGTMLMTSPGCAGFSSTFLFPYTAGDDTLIIRGSTTSSMVLTYTRQ